MTRSWKELLTAPQIAKVSGLPVRRVRKLIDDGLLKSARDDLRAVPCSAVIEYITEVMRRDPPEELVRLSRGESVAKIRSGGILIEDASQLCSVNRKTMYKYLERGLVRSLQGSRRMVCGADLVRFMESRGLDVPDYLRKQLGLEAPRSILLVGTSHSLAASLATRGYAVQHTECLFEAGRLSQTAKAVAFDASVGRSAAIAAAQSIRRNGGVPRVLVFLAAEDDIDTPKSFQKNGFSACLKHPVHGDALADALKELMETKREATKDPKVKPSGDLSTSAS